MRPERRVVAMRATVSQRVGLFKVGHLSSERRPLLNPRERRSIMRIGTGASGAVYGSAAASQQAATLAMTRSCDIATKIRIAAQECELLNHGRVAHPAGQHPATAAESATGGHPRLVESY